ncbi:hypothetical protein Taro_031707 [Colocasia esculenta]|uniref:DNA-directed RNA polymerase n=1 Tax=Colocasia esculenta TaxID=4460 RepID=A0A843VXC1_COLES|nr:hypothetical protein [Colocasia esculenta]
MACRKRTQPWFKEKKKVHWPCVPEFHLLTQQPVADRKRFGGVMFKEMERECLLAHGATTNLHKCLFTFATLVHVWKTCIYEESLSLIGKDLGESGSEKLSGTAYLPMGPLRTFKNPYSHLRLWCMFEFWPKATLASSPGRLGGVSVQTWTPTLTLASSDMDANLSSLHAQQS